MQYSGLRMSEPTEFERLMAEVAAGSEDAVTQLAEIYTPYILRAVRRSLQGQVRFKLESQDVAQSLWASLLLQRGDIVRLRTSEELIAFLTQAAKNKAIDKARYLRAQKRDVARETRFEDLNASSTNSRPSLGPPLFSRDPTPSTVVGFREMWRNMLANASERDRQIVTMLLEGNTFQQVGEILSIHERTVRRTVQKLLEALDE